jgi:hypothetical protein
VLRDHVDARGRFVDIPQAGHGIVLEQPQAVAEAMDVLPGMNAGVSIFATPSPIEGSRVAEADVGRLGIEPSAAKAYPSPA